MKRVLSVVYMALLILALGFVFISCDEPDTIESGISFKTLTVSGDKVFGKVSSGSEYFSFIDEVDTVGEAKYIVSESISGADPIATKTVELKSGDNNFYVIEMINGEPTKVYTVTVRRRPVYTVTFDSNGGTAVESQAVEEDGFATQPTASREGYTFVSWNHDFGRPITSDLTVTANWRVNTDTAYKVKYYLENVEKNSFDLIKTEEFSGTTDSTVSVTPEEIEHYTVYYSGSTLSGKIRADGSLELWVYYLMDKYTISSEAEWRGTVTNGGSYAYGSTVSATATAFLGCEFVGWYSGDTLVSTDETCVFTLYRNISAKFKIKDEMSNFRFSSSDSSCYVTGIIDKTVTEIVVPDYVDRIALAAFNGCSDLESLTIPFVGIESGKKGRLGEIFGRNKYEGSIEILQLYSYNQYSPYCLPASLKTVTVTGGEIYYGAFSNCSFIERVVLPAGGTVIGDYAFYNCTALESVECLGAVSDIGEFAFYSCTALRELSVPLGNNVIGKNAFYNCIALNGTLNLNATVTIGENAFYNCVELDGVNVPDIAVLCGSIFFDKYSNPLYYARKLYVNGELVTELVIPDGVTHIGKYAFSYCDTLTSAVIPNSVTVIEEGAFFGCSSLECMTVPFVGGRKDMTESDKTTLFGYIFGTNGYDGDYTACQDYKVSEYDYYLVTYCIPSALKKVIVTGGVIHCGAFSDCTSLTSAVIMDGVTKIDYGAFSGCSALESMTLPFVGVASEYTNPDGQDHLFGYIFGRIKYSGGASTLQWASNSDNGERYYIPTALKTVRVSGGQILFGAFSNCADLQCVELYGDITEIGECAFESCSKLVSVVLPRTLTRIDSYAFYYCAKLKNVNYCGTEEEWESVKKGLYWDIDSYYGSKIDYTVNYNYNED